MSKKELFVRISALQNGFPLMESGKDGLQSDVVEGTATEFLVV
jgi:hypothetical protein